VIVDGGNILGRGYRWSLSRYLRYEQGEVIDRVPVVGPGDLVRAKAVIDGTQIDSIASLGVGTTEGSCERGQFRGGLGWRDTG